MHPLRLYRAADIVFGPRQKSQPPATRTDWLRIFTINQKDLTFSCGVAWAFSERVYLCKIPIMVLPRSTKTYTSSGPGPLSDRRTLNDCEQTRQSSVNKLRRFCCRFRTVPGHGRRTRVSKVAWRNERPSALYSAVVWVSARCGAGSNKSDMQQNVRRPCSAYPSSLFGNSVS